MTSTVPPAPPRGTRPRNRREITVARAGLLFAERGFAAVSMSDIAEATNVRPSALYRHFASKAELLVAAIRKGMQPFQEVLAAGGDADADTDRPLQAVLDRMATASLDHRELGVLWQREARGLVEADQQQLRHEVSGLSASLAKAVAEARPELEPADADFLAWCVLSALVSPSFHTLRVPRRRFEALLADMAMTIAMTPLPAEPPNRAPHLAPPDVTHSRRDAVISAAIQLFADRGFAATGIDDIGAAVGIAGPSVYGHFGSKAAILVAAIERANALLTEEAAVVLAADGTARQKLALLVDSYVRVANEHRSVIRTLLSEVHQLPEPERSSARQLQRAYVDAWVRLLREYEAVDDVTARIRVQGVLLVVNDAVQTPHLRDEASFGFRLALVAKEVLGTAEPGGGRSGDASLSE